MTLPRDPQSLVALARAGHARGDDRRAVLRRCYGVAFPEEFFAILEDDPDSDSSALVWWIANPHIREEPYLRDDEALYAIDRELILLDDPRDAFADERVQICYRLDDLEIGASSIYQLPDEIDDYSEGELVTESLLVFQHLHWTEQLRRDQVRLTHPSNRGAGSIDSSDVASTRAQLAKVERVLAAMK